VNKRWKLYGLALIIALLLIGGAARVIFVVADPLANLPNRAALPKGVKASILLPAYWGSQQPKWNRLIENHLPGTIAIANYDAGPPTSNDSVFATTVERARASGIRILGYVPTGSHNNARIQSMIDDWYNYKMDGIFLDEATSITQSTSDIGFYGNLYTYIKGKSGPNVVNTLDVLNAGWLPTSADYLKTADIIMTFEGEANSFLKWQIEMPAWMKTTLPDHFSATVESIDSGQVQQWVQKLLKSNFGYIYLSEAAQNYGVIPNVYTDEVNALKTINGS
jgi:hypothetical protein